MNPLDALLTSLVDSAFPIMRDMPDDLDGPSLFHLLNPVVYGQKEVEGNYGK